MSILFLRMGNVQITFKILTIVFCATPIVFNFMCFSSFEFLNFLTSFDKIYFYVFWCLIGPRSFEVPMEIWLAIKLLFSSLKKVKGFGLISIVVNTLTTFLKSWMLVASSLASWFLVD